METVGLLEIFFFVMLSCLLSFGGGNGQIPVIQAQWVEPGVLAPGLFSFALAISYLTPGPKAGFIAGIGYYLAGVPGAIAAVLGLAIPTCLGSGGVSYALDKMKKIVELFKPSAGFVIAALIAAAAWGTASPMQLGSVEILVVAAVAFLVAWRNIDPVLIVLSGAVIGLVWSFLLV